MASEPATTASDMPADQLERARELAPQMVEVLAGWICCESSLAATELGFRERIKSAQQLRKVFQDANRIVQQIIGE